jgi:hypothetical protein
VVRSIRLEDLARLAVSLQSTIRVDMSFLLALDEDERLDERLDLGIAQVGVVIERHLLDALIVLR